MGIRVGINGFGRMGRLTLRAVWDNPDLQFVQINDPAGDAATLAHLLAFDSVHGRWDRGITADGEALVHITWISIDPTNRMWINETPSYLPPVGIGEVMRAAGLGEVVASNNPNFPVGMTVQGLVGWQEYTVISDAMPLFPVEIADGVSPSAYMGALGMTGLTAWVGIRDIGKPKPGETVVVSAAAGAVGSVAGQLAKAPQTGQVNNAQIFALL